MSSRRDLRDQSTSDATTHPNTYYSQTYPHIVPNV